MKIQTLTLQGLNLITNEMEDKLIIASNPFMLALKYIKAEKDFSIQYWNLINNEWEAGNAGINACAYLCETLEELTGMNLA